MPNVLRGCPKRTASYYFYNIPLWVTVRSVVGMLYQQATGAPGSVPESCLFELLIQYRMGNRVLMGINTAPVKWYMSGFVGVRQGGGDCIAMCVNAGS